MSAIVGFDFSQLTTEQRLTLVDALLESIDSELPVSGELAAELERRSEAVRSGVMATHAWEEVKTSLWPTRS